MTPLTFAPDADPTTPGVIRECTNLIPTKRGYQDAPQPAVIIEEPVEGAVRGAAMIQKLDGSSRLFVATQSGIEEYDGGWTTRYSVGDGPMMTAVAMFRQFGNVTLAGSFNLQLHQSESGDFEAIDGAPSPMSFCVTSNHQVMVVGYLGQPDGWACSAIGDHEDWTPDAATQAATGRFLATPGIMTACIEFGPHVLAFKERSMYWMRYVNVPLIWSTELISNEIGCVGPQALCDIGDSVFFVGPDDFYLFDGTRPIPIGGPVKDWFFGKLPWWTRLFVHCIYDPRAGLVRVTFASWVGDSTSLVYHPESRRWGVSNVEMRCQLIFRETVVEESGFGSAAFGPHVAGCVTLDNQVAALKDRTALSTFRLGWFGDDTIEPRLLKVRPRFLRKPSAASAGFYVSSDLTDETYVDAATLTEGGFGANQQAHWHSLEMRSQGPFEIAGITVDLPKSGGKR